MEFLGRIIQKRSSGQITMESLKNSLTICWVSSTSHAETVSRFSLFQKKIRSSEIRKVTHPLGKQLGSFCGCLSLEMTSSTQSRSYQDRCQSDFKNLKHLLKYVNQTRDFISIMDPQVPASKSLLSRNHSSPDCQLLRFFFGRMSTIKKVYQWLIDHNVLSQYCLNKPDTSFSVRFSSRARVVCYDSGSSQATRDQALHPGIQISNSFKRCQDHCQNRFFSGKDNGLTSRHVKKVKAHSAQALVISLGKVGAHHNPSDVLTRFVQVAVLGQLLQSPTLSKIQVCLRFANTAQVLRRSQRSSLSRKTSATLFTQICKNLSTKQHQGNSVRGQICMLDFDYFSGSARDSRSKVQRGVSHSSTRIHTTSACSDSELVVHANHCLLLSAHQKVDQQIKACSRTWMRTSLKRKSQEKEGKSQSHHNQQPRMSSQQCAQILSYVLFYSLFKLFATSLIQSLSSMSSSP